MESTDLIEINNPTVIPYDSEFSTIEGKQLKETHNKLKAFITLVLDENKDFGNVFGIAGKLLYKSGADKIKLFFGFTVDKVLIDKTIDFENKYISYTYRTIVKTRFDNQVAVEDRTCSTLEPKYYYSWIEKPKPDQEICDKMKLEGTGKFQKNFQKPGERATYKWMEKINNPNIMGLENTILSMAQKRSYVAAIKTAVGFNGFLDKKTTIDDLDIQPVVSMALQLIKGCTDKQEFSNIRSFFTKMEESIVEYKTALKTKYQELNKENDKSVLGQFRKELKELSNDPAEFFDFKGANRDIMQDNPELQKLYDETYAATFPDENTNELNEDEIPPF